ncbi:hypothetical protein M595_1799 [Lyngbya aestuarii BL J]|uniref:Uncharacterized protein n=1 Tax=Lyngbya aestuarii BL J TaxID=1348334 RepID=U7QM60_9CYAN|nr:hypothetical protein M595_1799 [Lyngbya aestuarii BL J]
MGMILPPNFLTLGGTKLSNSPLCWNLWGELADALLLNRLEFRRLKLILFFEFIVFLWGVFE